MALLRKAIPVIHMSVSGRFWIFVRGLQFFPGFRMVVADLIACGVHPVSGARQKTFFATFHESSQGSRAWIGPPVEAQPRHKIRPKLSMSPSKNPEL